MFIGCENYYCDMQPSCSHTINLMTDHSSLKKHDPKPWTDDMQSTAFGKIYALMTTDALVAYLDQNKWFDIHTDASGFQFHACFVQDGQPVASSSCKLSKSKHNYTVMEKENLSIVATLKEFQGMLLGANTHIY